VVTARQRLQRPVRETVAISCRTDELAIPAEVVVKEIGRAYQPLTATHPLVLGSKRLWHLLRGRSDDIETPYECAPQGVIGGNGVKRSPALLATKSSASSQMVVTRLEGHPSLRRIFGGGHRRPLSARQQRGEPTTPMPRAELVS